MQKEKKTPVTVYTDGGCDPNPGPGAWAAILVHKEHCKELSGGERRTTNNRMEMTAAIRALESLKRPCAVTLCTDSQYLQRGVTQWMPAWKQRNWRRTEGEIKNLDLWKRLDELTQVHHVRWRWVPGHSGDTLNERCDALVGEVIAKLKRDK